MINARRMQMSWLRILNIVILVLGLAAAIYYTAADKEAQGTVVVLAAILYFVAVPQITQARP